VRKSGIIGLLERRYAARMEVEGSEEYVWKTGLLLWKKPGAAAKGFPSQ
jgi:hypothetical protein